MKYYKATLSDIETLVNSRIDFLEEFWGRQEEEKRKYLKKTLVEYFDRSVGDGTYVSFIAKNGEEFAGVGGMVIRDQPGTFKNPSGKVAYLMNMYTVPKFRRKGICKKLLELLLEDGRNLGITLFELHATQEGEYVYSKQGFKIHPEPTYRLYS